MTVIDYIERNGSSFFASAGFEDEQKELRARTKHKTRELILVADINGRHVKTINAKERD